jgi:hypothetical protein
MRCDRQPVATHGNGFRLFLPFLRLSSPAARRPVREWLERFDGVDDVHFALQGTTGWRFVVEEIERVGHRAHLADPAETG